MADITDVTLLTRVDLSVERQRVLPGKLLATELALVTLDQSVDGLPVALEVPELTERHPAGVALIGSFIWGEKRNVKY